MRIYDSEKEWHRIVNGPQQGKIAVEDTAGILAFICTQIDGVQDVGVFGSRTKDRNVELIVLVTDPTWTRFRSLVDSEPAIQAYCSSPVRRLDIARQILREGFTRTLQAFELVMSLNVDVFLLPAHWEESRIPKTFFLNQRIIDLRSTIR